MALILVYFFSLLYASLSGVKDGMLYGAKSYDSFPWNEHIIFQFERLVVCWSIGVCALFELTLLDYFIWFICFGLAFSFWHNGFYYITRSKIDVPNYRFTSSSETSSAKIELNFIVRTVLKIVSIIGMIVYLFVKFGF